MDSPPSRETQEAYWDWWNTRYRVGSLKTDTERRGQLALELLDALGLEEPRILEVGCSTGWLSGRLADRGVVTAVDLSEASIAHATAAVPEVEFIAGDFMALDFEPASFDVVVTLETLAHVPDQSAFCRRIAAALRPSGFLVLTTQNAPIWKRSGVLREPTEIIQNLLTRPEVEALLKPHFEVRRIGTAIPFGHRGVFKILNSGKVNRFVGFFVGEDRLRRAKERLGLGNTIYVLARKPPGDAG